MDTQVKDACQLVRYSESISTALASKINTLSEVVSLPTCTLIVYAKKENYNELKNHIFNLTISLLKFIGNKKQLEENDLKNNVTAKIEIANEVAELLLDEYTDLPVEALRVFFKNAKLGKYGSAYGELSGGTIMLWFKDFYQEYWNEFYKHKEEENKATQKKVDEAFVQIPESTQRVFNQLAGRGYRTDAECQNKRTKEQIRREVISKNAHLYNEMSVDDADKAIDDAIRVALMAEGIFD